MANEHQRRLRRSKESERDLGRFLLQHNGPDLTLGVITSSTGRVGHITDLQFDVLSLDYAAENKHVMVSKQLLGWWMQIGRVAAKYGKHPLLRIAPSNVGKYPEMHIITADRHAELLRYEKLGRLSLRMSKENTEARKLRDL